MNAVVQQTNGGMQPPSNGVVASLGRLIDHVSGYLSPADVKRVRDAYRFSDAAHLGQFRASGEPYIVHPIAVAELCACWRLDNQALQAALLHDVMEDSGATKSELIEKFGAPVAELVDGLSKLDKIEFSSREEAQAENFRKMLLAMARDVRVILVKLADRLHNMRTLGVMSPEKRRRIAQETLDIYAPIANRLGLNEIFRELQELSFQHLHPFRYKVLHKAVLAARGNRREVVVKILDSVQKHLPANDIEAEVFGREKALFGIYRKMVDKQLSFSQVLDIYGFRIVVKDIATCYLTLGSLHQLYKPIPGKFKDYIAIAKINGYQSLHTTLIGPYGTPVEFQIRTREMHQIAENGVASHWLYKDSDKALNAIQKNTHQWLQSLLDIQNQTGDSAEFLEHIKVDLFPDAVYVFTPKGKILALPRGATVLDFAYAVHTDIGNQCISSKINHVNQALRTELKSGDVIDITTASYGRPNATWLSFVRTGKARSEIRHYLKNLNIDETINLGIKLLDQALETENVCLADLNDQHWEKLLKNTQVRSRDELLSDIGAGRQVAQVVVRRVLIALGRVESMSQDQSGKRMPIVIYGGEGAAVQRGLCCMPIPGDAIIAYLRKGTGLFIHTIHCPVARRNVQREPERWTDVQWDSAINRPFDVNIELDVHNEKGALARIAATFSDEGANISNLSMPDTSNQKKLLHFTIQVFDRDHLAKVLRAVRGVPMVYKIVRVRNHYWALNG